MQAEFYPGFPQAGECYVEDEVLKLPFSEAPMRWGNYYSPYVPVAVRQANASREVLKMTRKGAQVSPVKIAGRTIASTFWGKAWCDNLESYSDFSNRLPRGRTYVRNGSVVDLQIEPGKVTSLVSGSSLYRITVKIRPLAPPRWKDLKTQCGSQIGSLVELLQGRMSKSVMEVVTRSHSGLFPAPKEIEMSCSCPDWAGMCKHIAATLYGVGSRLDHEPELFFKLRQVDHLELIAQAGDLEARPKSTGGRRIATDQLADVFGIELEAPAKTTSSAPANATSPVQAAKPVRGRQFAPPEKKSTTRVGTAKPKGTKSSDSGRAVDSNGTARAAEMRKRIAQKLTERWKLREQKKQSGKIAAVRSPSETVGKATKAKLAQATGNKSGRSVRSRAT
jgi:uncharacterized Zn finger protein